MGSTKSSLSGLTEDILDEYTSLTYLSKAEILHLYKVFNQHGMIQDANSRVTIDIVEKIYPQLKCNPFRDRIYRVFSSMKDDRFSFEDTMDLCSVMSEKCPDKVKAAWAFRIFDFDEDNAVGENDLLIVIDRLTNYAGTIEEPDKKHIIKILLDEMDIESNGSVGQLEFQHAVGKMSEFSNSFCFRL